MAVAQGHLPRLASTEALLQLAYQLWVWGRSRPIFHCKCRPSGTRLAEVEEASQRVAHKCMAAAAEGFREQLAAGQAVPPGVQVALMGLAVTLGKLAHARQE